MKTMCLFRESTVLETWQKLCKNIENKSLLQFVDPEFQETFDWQIVDKMNGFVTFLCDFIFKGLHKVLKHI